MHALIAIVLMTLTNCGVNTGNPGDNSSKKGSTLVLQLPKSDAKQIDLNITGISLSTKNQTTNIKMKKAIKARSGQKVTLFSKQKIPSGSYQTLKIFLDNNKPLQVYDKQGKDLNVNVPPLSTYNGAYTRENNNNFSLASSYQSSSNGLIFPNLKNFDVDEKKSNTYSFSYDFSKNLTTYKETSSKLKSHFESANIDDDDLILDIFIPDSEVDEYCISTQACDNNDIGALLVRSSATNINRICVYPNDQITRAQSDLYCQESVAYGHIDDYGFYEAILPVGTYGLAFWSDDNFESMSIIKILDQQETELHISGKVVQDVNLTIDD